MLALLLVLLVELELICLENFSYYEMAIQLVGTVPEEFRIIYLFVTIALIICTLIFLMSPILLFKAIGNR